MIASKAAFLSSLVMLNSLSSQRFLNLVFHSSLPL
jgi:hypothetical protein